MPQRSEHVTFRLQPGSALERYVKASTAKNTTAKLHELAAAYEAVMTLKKDAS